ncbi:hypothetical protein GCM10011579_084040 [Streptomyces albiflavescens]|uniref:Uncharacterized protein n=1 Tax=Streptomyces albiflavescens TaxID=1623582 RepID=A0A917YFL1_9ACTN|nr:hypothetical protein GCM10011579_084040 [Streptomyces albiflavescens]
MTTPAISSTKNSTGKMAMANQPPQPQPPSYHIMPITFFGWRANVPYLQNASSAMPLLTRGTLTP